MKSFGPVAEFAYWVFRTGLTLVIALLIARALVEFVPSLEAFPPARALVRSWDPAMTDLLQPLGLSWSHEIRMLALPGAAIALIVLRTVLEDIVAGLFRAAPGKAGEPEAELDPEATAVNSGAPAPAAHPPAPDDAGSTGFRPAMAPAAEAPIPKRIGRYDIASELGRGAMGVVYKGLDKTIGRTVAIKTVSAVGSGPEVEEFRSRFLIEARSAGRLNHPGIVAVYDVTDDDSGRPSLVLEFVDGVPFDKLLAGKNLKLPQVLDVVTQIARALDYAHSHGIVHRDVKPANIMVTADGQAKLSDFGIAKMDSTGLTVAGQVLGTPAYMSPEQCTAQPVDQRSDVFSLGAVLYTASTGQRPFPGQSFTTVAYKVVHETPPPPSEADPALPVELDRIVMRCLAKLPADRYASAGELAADLDQLRAGIAAKGV